MTETSFSPGPDTARQFRDALGCFGTGVTVVTANTPEGPVAMTANSFSSVSLSPPLVLWCPAHASERHDPLVAASHFAIHVMAEDQQEVAVHFADFGDRFDAVDWTPDAHGTPLLSGSLARFDCRRYAVHDGGDHSIVVGEVQNVNFRPGKGLMFKRGQYGGFTGLL
ncbi:flavin reductase family protein [Primorskyibacter sp. S87]|uniref:flavin reductase family protein n=1 Tax=Primorskyibacter sp. S87 TaxID=3415126 RepID=UPI003C7C3FDB